MDTPSWLDELQLEPGPPWLDMGVRGLDASAWLLPDGDRERDLALKATLLADRHHEVFQALDTPEVHASSTEVLELVTAAQLDDAALAGPGIARANEALHPLDTAGRLVQEDLCLLIDRNGCFHLDAASLCFPSYWRLADKLGRPMVEVHETVAHYAEELSTKVDRFLTRLSPDRLVWRRNWSIHDDPSYFLPDADAPGRPVRPPEGLWLRSERQTLRRLPRTGAVLFTIRTQQVPLAVLSHRPELARRMAGAIDAWSREMHAYKGGHGALVAQPWLAAR